MPKKPQPPALKARNRKGVQLAALLAPKQKLLRDLEKEGMQLVRKCRCEAADKMLSKQIKILHEMKALLQMPTKPHEERESAPCAMHH
jgi:hypothetical protein